MFPVKKKLQDDRDGDREAALESRVHPLAGKDELSSTGLDAQKSSNIRPTPERKANQPTFPATRVAASQDIQTRIPVIVGDLTFRGTIMVDGILSGQPGANGGALSARQRGRTFFTNEPELNGEILFREMLRVNGHIAGTVHSPKGTLIVDTTARVDADVEVAIAVISGTVNGDIVAHQRVELAPSAKIHGNIWTRSLAIQRGAIFEGVCQMLEDKDRN